MKGNKKLSDIFIDKKIPAGTRRRLPVILSEDEIILVPGVCVYDRVKVTSDTKNVLRVLLTGGD